MMSIPREKWEWFGNAGHLIVGRDCRFHLATLVGPWWVSTVGEYLPDSVVRDMLAESRGFALKGIGDAREADWIRQNGWEQIGAGRIYETMVFRAGDGRCQGDICGKCGIPLPDEWEELDADGYNTAGDATRGHYAMCEKWAAMSAEDAP